MIDGAALWLTTFASVFLLGFQSRNVNAGKMVMAGLTSMCLAAAQIIAVRSIADGNPWVVLALTGTASPAGIMSAMVVHRRCFRR